MHNVNLEIINLNPVVEVQFSLHEAVRELVLLVTPESPSSFVICSGQLLNNLKSLSENIDSDWKNCQPIKLVIINSHYFSFWTNLSISFGLTNHCPYSTLKHYFTPTQFISRKFGICRSCDPKMLQSGYSYFECPLCSCLEVLVNTKKSNAYCYKCGKYVKIKEKLKCSKSCSNDTVILQQIRDPKSFRLPRRQSDVCGICFDDGFTEMVLYESSTINGPCHSFCIDCFKRHAEISVKERKLNFDHDGTYLPCPICQTETKNWNCHILYLAGDSIYNLFQKVSTEYTIVKNLKNGIICPNPKCGAGFESDIDYIGASIKCPECKYYFCTKCKMAAHPLKSKCEKGETPDDTKSLLFLNNMKHCPFCDTPSEKSDGCNHIICQMPSCRREWCYICESEWGFECMKRHWGTEDLPLIATIDDMPI